MSLKFNNTQTTFLRDANLPSIPQGITDTFAVYAEIEILEDLIGKYETIFKFGWQGARDFVWVYKRDNTFGIQLGYKTVEGNTMATFNTSGLRHTNDQLTYPRKFKIFVNIGKNHVDAIFDDVYYKLNLDTIPVTTNYHMNLLTYSENFHKFSGKVDKFMIWNRTLSEDEYTKLMNTKIKYYRVFAAPNRIDGATVYYVDLPEYLVGKRMSMRINTSVTVPTDVFVYTLDIDSFSYIFKDVPTTGVNKSIDMTANKSKFRVVTQRFGIADTNGSPIMFTYIEP